MCVCVRARSRACVRVFFIGIVHARDTVCVGGWGVGGYGRARSCVYAFYHALYENANFFTFRLFVYH